MNNRTVERWGMIELAFPGKKNGNPFTDYDLKAVFRHEKETVETIGFYDGDGIYKVRFMPSYTGEYSYEVSGTFSDCTEQGSFTATDPGEGNHGPVRAMGFHFVYADGTPHYDVGTTSYGFALQKKEILEETFETLKAGSFNKMRFLIFPKHYDFCLSDPAAFPFEGTPMDASVLTRQNFGDFTGKTEGNHWDFERFNPEFFRIYDDVILRLQELGIEADLILFHAYDRWGFSGMPMEVNLRYVRYVCARYGAFRNVWWSLANEYELLPFQENDWERLAEEVKQYDPYGHLLSIHNCETFYDYSKPWISHCSCQRFDHHKTTEFTDDMREKYHKPVIWDEVGYEGDLPHCWGNFTPEELVRRGWEALIRGGYCGHSETFLADDNVIWWAHGGSLKGESAARFGFMRSFLDSVPGTGLKLWHGRDDVKIQWDDYIAVPEDPGLFGSFYFYYYSIWRPAYRQIWIDDETEFDVDIIDTWNMTVTNAGRHRGRFELQLPGKQYIGVRLTKVCKEKTGIL